MEPARIILEMKQLFNLLMLEDNLLKSRELIPLMMNTTLDFKITF